MLTTPSASCQVFSLPVTITSAWLRHAHTWWLLAVSVRILNAYQISKCVLRETIILMTWKWHHMTNKAKKAIHMHITDNEFYFSQLIVSDPLRSSVLVLKEAKNPIHSWITIEKNRGKLIRVIGNVQMRRFTWFMGRRRARGWRRLEVLSRRHNHRNGEAHWNHWHLSSHGQGSDVVSPIRAASDQVLHGWQISWFGEKIHSGSRLSLPFRSEICNIV